MTINVNDVDEFDVGAVTDSDAAANAVDENAAIGTAVGITASASDADATNNTITYSLHDDDGGRFAIDSEHRRGDGRRARSIAKPTEPAATSPCGRLGGRIVHRPGDGDQHQRCR